MNGGGSSEGSEVNGLSISEYVEPVSFGPYVVGAKSTSVGVILRVGTELVCDAVGLPGTKKVGDAVGETKVVGDMGIAVGMAEGSFVGGSLGSVVGKYEGKSVGKDVLGDMLGEPEGEGEGADVDGLPVDGAGLSVPKSLQLLSVGQFPEHLK